MANAHAHDHDDDHGEHGLAHVASKKILLGTGITLLFLTLITVMATHVDFGGQMNLVVAMLIATVKASLVALFFMHLRYDKPFHAIAVVSGLLFALLFVAFSFMDGNQYQNDVCEERGADCKLWKDEVKEYHAHEGPWANELGEE